MLQPEHAPEFLLEPQVAGELEGARQVRLQDHAPALHPLAGQGRLGKASGRAHRRPGLRVADGRRLAREGVFPRGGRGRGQRGHRPHKRGRNTKIHLAVDAHGMPLRVLVSSGSDADCAHAPSLVSGFRAEYVIGDKGYDSDALAELFERQGMKVCIPPRSNRKNPREMDTHLYRVRHLVENAFLRLKEWRGIATRYAKRQASFLSVVCLRCAYHMGKNLVTTCSRIAGQSHM